MVRPIDPLSPRHVILGLLENRPEYLAVAPLPTCSLKLSNWPHFHTGKLVTVAIARQIEADDNTIIDEHSDDVLTLIWSVGE